jgi:hypothetical protein
LLKVPGLPSSVDQCVPTVLESSQSFFRKHFLLPF